MGETPWPPPHTQPGSFASTCSSNAECLSGLCATDLGSGQSFCTAECSPSLGGCPLGASCIAAGARNVCSMPASAGLTDDRLAGGCGLAGRPGLEELVPVALALLALLWRRRRR